MLAVPAFGQVDGDVAAAVAGGTGGDGDQVTADRGAAGLGERAAGQRAGGAEQVMRHRRDGTARPRSRRRPRMLSLAALRLSLTCATGLLSAVSLVEDVVILPRPSRR